MVGLPSPTCNYLVLCIITVQAYQERNGGEAVTGEETTFIFSPDIKCVIGQPVWLGGREFGRGGQSESNAIAPGERQSVARAKRNAYLQSEPIGFARTVCLAVTQS